LNCLGHTLLKKKIIVKPVSQDKRCPTRVNTSWLSCAQ
jgi:hypothetical protein